MSENNNNPATPPADAGPAAGGQPQATQNQTPTPPSGPGEQNLNNGGTNQVSIDVMELNALKRKAGRWDKHVQGGGNKPPKAAPSLPDDADPDLIESVRLRDLKIGEQSLAIKRLELKDRVRDLVGQDEYSGLPAAIKKAIVNNPLGFIKTDSSDIEEMMEDITSYIDEALDNPQPSQPQNNPPQKPDVNNTPPANGSGPSKPSVNPMEGVEGKTGPARSTAVLGNLLKGRGSKN